MAGPIRIKLLSSQSQHLLSWLHCRSIKLAICAVQSRGNHYEVLGVKQDATTNEIRAAFLDKSKEYHPDVSNGESDHDKFVKVNDAWSVLGKQASRKDYDRQLASGRASAFDPEAFYSQQSPYQQSQGHYYHHPNSFYDPQIHRSRSERPQDQFYNEHSAGGFRGVPKISNANIVLGCLVFMLSGIVLHTVVVRSSSDKHLKQLADRDVKIHAMWMDAKNNANKYTKEEHLVILKDYQAELNKAKSQSQN